MAAPSLFISYASQDREAARALRDGLAAAGFEVWYDENELGGGDAWDQKIRRQIRECAYFMPVISANTDARHEGYFRREWRLAVERTLDMADDVTFLLPVTIDDTPQVRARVPEKFLSVQWLSVPGGKPNASFKVLCDRLLVPPRLVERVACPELVEWVPNALSDVARKDRPALPPFPEQKHGQTLHFLFMVAGWAPRYVWAWYLGLSRGWRRLVIALLVVFLVERGCSPRRTTVHLRSPEERAAEANEIKQGTEIAARVVKQLGLAGEAKTDVPLLIFPFTAPERDSAAGKFATSVFGLIYGREQTDQPGKVGLGSAKGDPRQIARQRDAEKMLVGTVGGDSDLPYLEVKITAVEDGNELWAKRFPIKDADPSAVANEVVEAANAH